MGTIVKYLEVKTTTINKIEAQKIAEALIESRAAACVQIIENVKSLYTWKDGIESELECLLFIKTTSNNYEECERIIKENHSYETPEIIATEIVMGSKEYLDWLQK